MPVTYVPKGKRRGCGAAAACTAYRGMCVCVWWLPLLNVINRTHSRAQTHRCCAVERALLPAA